MKRLMMVALMTLLMVPAAHAVSTGDDIATTIRLRGHDCGAGPAHSISQTRDRQGNQIITATCPNGKRYRIVVTPQGRLTVTPR